MLVCEAKPAPAHYCSRAWLVAMKTLPRIDILQSRNDLNVNIKSND